MVRVEIIGNLGRDCSIHEGKNGGKFVSMAVAAREFVNGEEKTQWFDCVWFNYNDKMVQYLKKGSGVYLSGSLDCVNEIGNDGATYLRRKVTVDYVTFNSTGKSQDENGGNTTTSAQATAKVPSMTAGKKEVVPEVPTVAPEATVFQPEPVNNGDLPF